MPMVETFTFQSAATTNVNGNVYPVKGLGTLQFDVAITGGSGTVNFEAAGQSGTYVALPVVNVATEAKSTTATATGTFRANVTSLENVRARISGISGATITVLGQAVEGGTGPTVVSVSGTTAGETHIGEVGHAADVVDVTLTTDTAAYASGDLIADTQSFTGMRVAGGRGMLYSLTVIDEDDQGVAFTVYFLSANNTFGTENSAPSISDASARDILGFVDVATADYKDIGGVRIASIKNINLMLESTGATTNLFLAVVNGAGTPTFTATGVKLKLGILWY